MHRDAPGHIRGTGMRRDASGAPGRAGARRDAEGGSRALGGRGHGAGARGGGPWNEEFGESGEDSIAKS